MNGMKDIVSTGYNKFGVAVLVLLRADDIGVTQKNSWESDQ